MSTVEKLRSGCLSGAGEINRSAQLPTIEELLDCIAGRKPVVPQLSPADAVRAERNNQ